MKGKIDKFRLENEKSASKLNQLQEEQLNLINEKKNIQTQIHEMHKRFGNIRSVLCSILEST